MMYSLIIQFFVDFEDKKLTDCSFKFHTI